MPRAASPLDLARVRGWWLARQALAAPSPRGPSALVARTGWLPAAGSAGPYLSLRARSPSLHRAEVDAEVESGSLVEVPAVRGGAMLVPAGDVPLALAAAQRPNAKRFARLAKATGVTEREVTRLGETVLDVLGGDALPADGLRARLPPSRIKSLGEPGRKLGDPTTLSVALRHLVVCGRLRRHPGDGRLDARRFEYACCRRPVPPLDLSAGDLDRELTLRLLRWAGPATEDEVANWAELGKHAAVSAIAAAGGIRIAVASFSTGFWIAPEDEADLRAHRPRRDGDVVLLPFRDNYVAMRRPTALLLSPEHTGDSVLDWRHRPAAVGAVDSLHHHAIVRDGLLAGIWEVDPETGAVAGRAFGGGRTSPAIERALEETERFIRDEIGDLAFYALDSPRHRRERLASVRGAAADA